MDLKSNLFRKNNYHKSPNFENDFKTLASLPPNVIVEIPCILLESNGKINEDIINKESTKLQVSYTDLKDSMQVTNAIINDFFYDGDAYNDKIEDIVEDLLSLEYIEEYKKDNFIEFIEQIREVSPKLESIRNKEQHKLSGLPNLENIVITVNYRAVIDKDITNDMDVDDYNPKCVSVIPIAIVHITTETHDGNQNDIYFQMDKKEIKRIMKQLKTIEKQFEISANTLNLKGNLYNE